MVSNIESRFNVILETHNPPIPKINDLLVQTFKRVHVVGGQSEHWDFPYYYHQLDCVTLPGTLPEVTVIGGDGVPETVSSAPKLPVDYELDDSHHMKLKYIRKDHSRDLHLWGTDYWEIVKAPVPNLIGLSGLTGWVIVRIKYEDLEAVVRSDRTLNLAHRKLKDQVKQESYRREHQVILDNIYKCIDLALVAEEPCRISLVDGVISTVNLKSSDGD